MGGVSVIVAALNEEPSIATLLHALDRQSVPPDEVIIADGGSTDGTVEKIFEAARNVRFDVKVLPVPGNISRARNAAIADAAYDVIAVTDADCRPETVWLEELTRPFGRGARAVAGAYRASAHASFERAVATFTWIPLRGDERRAMPSHRSVAFQKSLWQAIGGYDERIDWGEDTLFDLAVHKRGGFALAPLAVVDWKPRKTFASAVRQQLSYGAGDGQARSQRLYHMAIAAFVLSEVATFFAPVRIIGTAVVLAAFLNFLMKNRRLFGRLLPDAGYVLVLTLVLPPARLAGYAMGLAGVPVRRLLFRS